MELIPNQLAPAGGAGELSVEPAAEVLEGRWRFRVRFGDFRERWVDVAEGLTIGRSAGCGLMVDEEAAWPIHAIVAKDKEGIWFVATVGEARLALADGRLCDRVLLREGARFYLGMARLECVRVVDCLPAGAGAVLRGGTGVRAGLELAWTSEEIVAKKSEEENKSLEGAEAPVQGAASDASAEEKAIDAPAADSSADDGCSADGLTVEDEPREEAANDVLLLDLELHATSPQGLAVAWGVEAATGLPGPVLLACPECREGLGRLPAEARFCPGCGGVLPLRDANGVLIPPAEGSPLFALYARLRGELGAITVAHDAGTPNRTAAQASSLVVLSYANALLGLGWRYEHGRGMVRNAEEASRCYAKAGRLWKNAKGE